MDKPLHGTTIICLKNADKVIIAGDGLVCDDNIVAKNILEIVAKYDLYTSNKITIESLEIKKPTVLI